MSKILLSIKPEYVEKILSGEKKFEFRKRLTKVDVESLIIYATAPAMEVVAEVKVEGVLSCTKTKLWEETKSAAGITRAKYREYFNGSKVAYAFKLGEIMKYEPPKKLNDLGVTAPPQSFVYIED